jgi:nucleotide-binding universal stress UspA family protein
MYARILVSAVGPPESDAALTAGRTLAAALDANLVEAPPENVVAEAALCHPDLVVLGVHDYHDLDRVLTHVRVPVLTVRAIEFRLERLQLLLVPFDGSTGAHVALGHAASLARAAGAALVLLRVVRPLPLWIFDPNLGLNTGPLIDPRWDETRREHAEAYVRQVAGHLADTGLEVGADALLGEVAPTIAEYAATESVDLIVMATHARRGPARALLGSTADEVVRTAPRPVLVVRRDGPRGQPAPV